MSLFRLVVSSLFVVVSAMAFNAYADDTSAQAQASASAPAAAQGAAPAAHRAGRHHHAAAAKIDINSADAATLAKIKGISMKKAQQIIAYRDKNGPFKSLDDLRNVTNANGKPLFTDRTLRRLEARLTLVAAQ